MPDVMAIVNKAVFEKEVAEPRLGAVFATRASRSANKILEKLEEKSRLFLVTVRPPDEKLWLVAALTGLKFEAEQWNAEPYVAPKQCFASGGVSAEVRGAQFVRGEAENKGRVLYCWMPVELADQSKQIAQSVKGSLNRLKAARAR